MDQILFTHLWVGKVEVFYFLTVVNSATVGKPRELKGGKALVT